MALSPGTAWSALAGAQRQALVQLFQSTQGPAWRHKDNWLVGDPCENRWHGVGCSPDGQVVRSLNLPGNHLQGELPGSFASLNTLEVVDLRSNMGLSGQLPSLGAFPALTQLNLSFNQFKGPIPPLSHLVRLQSLVLSNNLLTGPLPELSGLPALQNLRVNHNQLSGALPSLANLGALQTLDLSFNHFEGPLPELSHLSQLSSFQADWNRFEGSVPSPSGLLHLHTLSLSGNQLSGELPPLRNLPALTQLALDRNRLSGPLPRLNDLIALNQLNLAHNLFTGPLPELSRLVQLRRLQVEGNQLSGPLPERPPQLSQATLCPNLFTEARTTSLSDGLPGEEVTSSWGACEALSTLNPRSRGAAVARPPSQDHGLGKPLPGLDCELGANPSRLPPCASVPGPRRVKATVSLTDATGLPPWSEWVMALSALLAFVTMVMIWRLSWLSQSPQVVNTGGQETPLNEHWLHSKAPPPSETTRSFRPRPSWPPR